MEAWRQDLYLAHHGILGQKWGKRNGPPYPLDADDRSVAEKRAAKEGGKKSLSERWEDRRFNKIRNKLNSSDPRVRASGVRKLQRRLNKLEEQHDRSAFEAERIEANGGLDFARRRYDDDAAKKRLTQAKYFALGAVSNLSISSDKYKRYVASGSIATANVLGGTAGVIGYEVVNRAMGNAPLSGMMDSNKYRVYENTDGTSRVQMPNMTERDDRRLREYRERHPSK